MYRPQPRPASATPSLVLLKRRPCGATASVILAADPATHSLTACRIHATAATR